MTSPDIHGTAGQHLCTELNRAGIAYRIDPWPGALAMIIATDTPGNVVIIPLPDGTEVRVTDENGSTAYAPDEHRGWQVLHYQGPEADEHTQAVYESTSPDIEADSAAAVEAITRFADQH